MPKYWYDHIHVASPDPLKTAEFYEKMFGAKRISVREPAAGRVSVDLTLNGQRVLIKSGPVQKKAPSDSSEPAYGIEHFGIGTDDLEATVAELKANGVEFRDEIRESRPGVKICFIWGPEDTLIELLERGS